MSIAFEAITVGVISIGVALQFLSLDRSHTLGFFSECQCGMTCPYHSPSDFCIVVDCMQALCVSVSPGSAWLTLHRASRRTGSAASPILMLAAHPAQVRMQPPLLG